MLVAEAAFEGADEFAAAVGAFDLAVAEQVDLRQQFFAKQLAGSVVVFAPVVAVGELEAVNVPFGRMEVRVRSGRRQTL